MKQADNNKLKQKQTIKTIQTVQNKITNPNYVCKPKDKIDTIDLKIIRLLSRDCRRSFNNISSLVSITPNAVKERINTMVCNSIIQNFIVNVNPVLFGYEKECFLMLTHFKRTAISTKNISDHMTKQLSLVG